MHCNKTISARRAGLIAVALGFVSLAPVGHVTAEEFVAGVAPWQRPASAPKISKFQPGTGWLGWAARGVSDPKPASLKFLDDQGAWYNPFTMRGMPGRYDIRGLHAMPAAQPGSR